MAGSDSRMKRVLYRARHRGTKEMDLVLGGFADAELMTLAPADMADFEELLSLPDPDIDGWVHGREPPPHLATLIKLIRRHHGLRAKE